MLALWTCQCFVYPFAWLTAFIFVPSDAWLIGSYVTVQAVLARRGRRCRKLLWLSLAGRNYAFKKGTGFGVDRLTWSEGKWKWKWGQWVVAGHLVLMNIQQRATALAGLRGAEQIGTLHWHHTGLLVPHEVTSPEKGQFVPLVLFVCTRVHMCVLACDLCVHVHICVHACVCVSAWMLHMHCAELSQLLNVRHHHVSLTWLQRLNPIGRAVLLWPVEGGRRRGRGADAHLQFNGTERPCVDYSSLS